MLRIYQPCQSESAGVVRVCEMGIAARDADVRERFAAYTRDPPANAVRAGLRFEYFFYP